jgi:hypothetical protein
LEVKNCEEVLLALFQTKTYFRSIKMDARMGIGFGFGFGKKNIIFFKIYLNETY